jgi:hypothetical protein
MAKCIFDNLTSTQAIILAQWFEGQGEQDCIEWFYEQREKSPQVRTIFIDRDTSDVTIYCK